MPDGQISLRRLRTLLLDALAGAVACIGAISLAGFLAAHAWPFELMCHFRLQYAVALLACGLLLAIARRWRWTLIAAALAAVNAWTLLPFRAWPVTPRDQSPPTLRVLSANLYSGNSTPDRFIAYIDDADPDVLVALEVTPDWEQRLAELHDSFPYRAVQSRPGNFGIALYSRLPIIERTFAPLSESNSAIVARLDVDGRTVTLIAAHPYPPGGSRNTTLRNSQLSELARLAAASAGPCIVAGDLNVTPFSPAFDRLLDAGNLRDPRRGQGLLPTWPASRPLLQIPIDHCLVRDIAEVKLAVGPALGSDHLPLVADMEID